MKSYLSIDIGGTYMKWAFFDSKWQMYGRRKIKTDDNIHHMIIEQLKQLVHTAITEENIQAIGISTAGIVDRTKGAIHYAGPTIPGYTGTPLKQVLSDSFGLPVHVENDVNAALLGELWQGAGRGQNHLYCITLGTGIGGSYYQSGIADGYHLQADAVGYLLYEPKTKTNYEMRASTSALNRVVHRELGTDVTTEEVFTRAKNGDISATDIVRSWTKEIARGLAQIILIHDPARIIIGGGVSAQGGFLLKLIQDGLVDFLPSGFLKTELEIARLTNDAALYGAVYPYFKKEANKC